LQASRLYRFDPRKTFSSIQVWWATERIWDFRTSRGLSSGGRGGGSGVAASDGRFQGAAK
jgi:hypothetical protein